MNPRPSVSFIVTVYNKEYFLPAVFDAMLAQSGDFEREYVIVNDGSTDNSLALIREFAERTPDVVVIDQPNGGCSKAMNAGVAAATKEWLKPVDADDLLAPDTTERLLAGAGETGCRLIYGNNRLYDTAEITQFRPPPIGHCAAQEIPDRMMFVLRQSSVNPSSMLIATDLYRGVGGCDPRLRYLQDYSLVLKSVWREPMAHLPAVVFWKPAESLGRVSDNKARMYQNMNLVLYEFLSQNPDLPGRYKRYALRRAAGRAYNFARRHRTHPNPLLFGALKTLSYLPVALPVPYEKGIAFTLKAFGAAVGE